MPNDPDKILLAENILFVLRDSPSGLTPNQLMKSFSLKQEQLIKSIMMIKSWGYQIDLSVDRIKFIEAPDRLIDTEIRYNLKTKFIGQNVFTYQTVKSTNDIAAGYAESGEAEGTLITSEEQTQGRGRLGRNWHSPKGCNAYLSIILKPKFRPDKAPAISILTALALVRTLEEKTEAPVKIKWPNDILLNGKKVAGILTELSADHKNIHHLIVGVGININQLEKDFPEELRPIATSLLIENKKEMNRVELIKDFLTNFEQEYLKYCLNQKLTSLDKIRSCSSLIGREISLSYGNKIISGRAVEIDHNGALIIEQDGKRTVITSGEVTVVKNNLFE